MERKYNLFSFYLSFFCLGFVAYSFFSNLENIWLLAPPNYVLLFISFLAFVFGIIGFKDKRNRLSKIRSWVTLTVSSITSIVLFLTIVASLFFSFMGVNEHIETTRSPDKNYTIHFYQWDTGATGSFGIRGELDGPLWFKKRIYYEIEKENVVIEWDSNSVVTINGHKLNLDEGETYGY
ncbi:DUF5412 family protein [Evansella sp. AB-rgal1]|uniref:DUF5412 family protein n=1 Tax=Evansella sp. AB-rgal1 TaxID=3242696 RepID=UPI00359E49F3